MNGVRVMRILLVLICVLAACGTSTSASSTTEPPTTMTSSVATATTEPVGPTSTSTTSTTEAPPPEPVVLDNPVIELVLPDGVIVDWKHSVAVGEQGWVVVAGDWSEKGVPRNPGFWHTSNGVTWDSFRLAEIVPTDFVEISDLVSFDGRFIASLIGDATVVDPTVVLSDDGVTWTAESMRVGSSVGLLNVFATPESPPWPGASAITDMAVLGDELVAVGWVQTDQGSSPAVWRTLDAKTWSRSLLPNQYSPNEWAQRVAVGEAGYLVTGLGPFHQPDYLWSSSDGETWKPVQLTKGYFFGHGGIAVGDAMWTTLLFDGDEPEELYRSTDGVMWEEVSLPETPAHGGCCAREMVGFGPDWLMLITEPETRAGSLLSSDGTHYLLPVNESPAFCLAFHHAMVVATADWGLGVTAVHPWQLTASVVDVASDDVLNVRAGPNADRDLVATLPFDATGVYVMNERDNGWQLILGPTGQVGWVNGAFLSAES